MQPEGRRYSRGYLPHIDVALVPQFITFRLADSLPKSVVRAWHDELRDLPESDRRREVYAREDAYLDSGQGSCILADPVAADIVKRNIEYGRGNRYRLHAYCVMPNHVHALVTPLENCALAQSVQFIKSFSSSEIHKALGGSGALWQREYFDRMIRSAEHFERVRRYVEWNPVKAKLCADPKQFAWSSCGLEMDPSGY